MLGDVYGFEWDEHNIAKILEKHGVIPAECESIFQQQETVVVDDVLHSEIEERFYAYGKSPGGKYLVVVFTLRDELIRVVTARQMTKKERRWYLAL